MPNYGFLNNMASGIREAMTAYQTMQKDKRDQKMMGLLRGVQENPATGEYEYTPEKRAQIDQQKQMQNLQLQKAQHDLDFSKENQDRDLERRFKESQIAKNLRDAKGGDNGGLAGLIKQLQAEKLVGEVKKQREEATPMGKLEKGGQEVKKSVGGLADMQRSLNELGNEYEQGNSKSWFTSDTPLLGRFIKDNPVDIQTRKLSDDIGRLRSGGAISKDEEARFLRMLPTAADSAQGREYKMNQLGQEIDTRLRGYGFSTKQLPELGLLAQEPQTPASPKTLTGTKTINGKTYKKVPGGWQEI